MKAVWLGVALTMSGMAASVQAQEPDDPLVLCIAAHARPDDARVLTRWLVATLSLDPAVADITRVTASERSRLNTQYAGLVQDVLTKRCRREVVAGLRKDGPATFDTSFGLLLESTLQQSIGVSVTTQARQIGRAMDRAAVSAVFAEAGLPPPPAAVE